jgi:hypothetical protein
MRCSTPRPTLLVVALKTTVLVVVTTVIVVITVTVGIHPTVALVENEAITVIATMEIVAFAMMIADHATTVVSALMIEAHAMKDAAVMMAGVVMMELATVGIAMMWAPKDAIVMMEGGMMIIVMTGRAAVARDVCLIPYQDEESYDDGDREDKNANVASYGVDTNWYADTGATHH